MSDIYDRQKQQDDIQRNDVILDAFSRIVSGKAGYKTVIEKKKAVNRCRKCNLILDSDRPPKFCPECGAKVWLKPTTCQKCAKAVFVDDKFCTDCGESLEAPPL